MATRAYIFDLDGVLYRGEEAIEGAAETLARLRRRENIALFFLTNNSTQTRADYALKLTRLGMPCVEEEIVTSASATAAYLRYVGGADRTAAASRTAFVVGGAGITDELRRIGMTLVAPEGPPEDTRADYVVVGLDRQFTYEKLWRAQQAILHGAVFVATNRDGQFPIEGGEVTPGGGSMVAALQTCTDTIPVVVGKPETHGLEAILRAAEVAPDEALMIGDRLDTDVACGNRLGVPTVLVLTGVTSEAKAREAVGDERPGRILFDLRELE